MERSSSKYFRINWILNNQLAIGPAPLKKQHLDLLQQEGLAVILSLCDIKEVKIPESINTRFICKRFVLPDHKAGRLPSIIEINQSINILSDLMQKGPVFVHCVAAMERSPLICMAWLVKKNKLNPQEALDYMMQSHSGTNPLPGQLALLKDLNKSD